MALMKAILFLLHGAIALTSTRKNVLFLVSDDMRPELSSFIGPDFPSPVHPKIHSPNLDELAEKSLLLKRAYVQQAVCSPSRTSLLTGRRPDTTHVYDLIKYFRKVGGNFTTIPQYFKQHGYTSIGMGKIFHPGSASDNDDPISWSVPYFHGTDYYRSQNHSWIAVDKKSRDKQPLIDDQVATQAIKTLHKLAETPDQPFFLGVGFHKPHLPFIFPEEFLDYYPPWDIRLPDNQYAPAFMPKIAWSNYNELRSYKDIKNTHRSGDINTTLPVEKVIELRMAYYSSLSYTDSLIGNVLSTLKELGLESNTIVSFLGDHGWQLGEHGEWCKHTNFELATHAPMMVHVPGLTDKGLKIEELTEFVDLFPTLVEAAGLPSLPLCPTDSSHVELCTEGTSMIPLITNKMSRWKDRVFSQYPRDGDAIMGYSMRTDRYRYTEWVKFKGHPVYKPVWEKSLGTELYDHKTDPEENYNRAEDPVYENVKAGLKVLLHKGWRAALPSEQRTESDKQLKFIADTVTKVQSRDIILSEN